MATGEEGGTGAAVAGAEAAEDGEVVVEDFEKKKIANLSINQTFISARSLFFKPLFFFFFGFSFADILFGTFPFFLIFVLYENRNYAALCTLSQ